MIRFFYGENTYSLRAMAKKIVADFVEKQKSDLNVVTLESAKLTFESFSDAVLSAPFLGDRKLTIVKNLVAEKEHAELRKKIMTILPKLPANSDVVFIDAGKPDGRDGLFKWLTKNSTVKYYSAADESLVRRFIAEKIAEQNIKISPPALSKLTLYAGSDLWRLANEVAKLSAFTKAAGRDEITPTDVEALVEPDLELKVFDLTDALASRNSKRSIELLDKFIRKNEDLHKVFNLVIYQIRTMITVKELLERNERNIAKICGLHPFVAQKTEALSRKITFTELTNFYEQIEEQDFLIKTGRTEIQNSLVLLFVNFCRNGKIV